MSCKIPEAWREECQLEKGREGGMENDVTPSHKFPDSNIPSSFLLLLTSLTALSPSPSSFIYLFSFTNPRDHVLSHSLHSVCLSLSLSLLLSRVWYLLRPLTLADSPLGLQLPLEFFKFHICFLSAAKTSFFCHPSFVYLSNFLSLIFSFQRYLLSHSFLIAHRQSFTYFQKSLPHPFFLQQPLDSPSLMNFSYCPTSSIS